jgi:hypothetical protein
MKAIVDLDDRAQLWKDYFILKLICSDKNWSKFNIFPTHQGLSNNTKSVPPIS